TATLINATTSGLATCKATLTGSPLFHTAPRYEILSMERCASTKLAHAVRPRPAPGLPARKNPDAISSAFHAHPPRSAYDEGTLVPTIANADGDHLQCSGDRAG